MKVLRTHLNSGQELVTDYQLIWLWDIMWVDSEWENFSITQKWKHECEDFKVLKQKEIN